MPVPYLRALRSRPTQHRTVVTNTDAEDQAGSSGNSTGGQEPEHHAWGRKVPDTSSISGTTKV